MHEAGTETMTLHPQVQGLSGTLFAIGEVAQMFGVTLRTIRFYCERKLIAETTRTSERFFDVHNIERLWLILEAKALGFSLNQIETFLVDKDNTSGRPALIIPLRDVDQEIEMKEKQQNELLMQLTMLTRCKADIRTRTAA